MSETNSAPTSFYFLKDLQRPRSLGLSPDSKRECFIPDGHPDATTINQLWDNGVDGLVGRVEMVLLGLLNETFSTNFLVSYIPQGERRYSRSINVGQVEIANKNANAIIGEVRNLVNARLLAA